MTDHHCRRFLTPAISRRQMLRSCASGFGAVALSALLNDNAFTSDATSGPMTPRPTHFPAKCRNVIFLYMDGGPSQVDTFDPKPLLTKEHGQPFKMKMEPTQFANNGATLGSPWAFKPGGTCGTPVSDHSSQNTPPPTTSCIPALGCRGGRVLGRGSRTAWGANARTCRGSWCSTAA